MASRNLKEKLILDHLLTNVPTVGPTTTVYQALRLLRHKNNWSTINYIYVLDGKRQLVGVVSIKELLRADDDTEISRLMTREPVGIVASAKQERASIVAIAKNIKAVPVFKPGTREFLGVVGPDKILSTLHQEHIEDILKFSGFAKSHPTVDFFKAPVSALVKARIPWLIVGLVAGIIGATLVGFFQPTLEEEIAIAFFIPVVVYISNAVSTQTQALLLRLLTSQRVRIRTFMRKELVVSLFLALFSATAVSLYTFFWIGQLAIAMAVGLSILAGTLASVSIAITVPLVLYASHKDPALGTGPFATALQDVTSLVIYFLIATSIVL